MLAAGSAGMPRGVANPARTRIRMASEQDEEEEQVSWEWRRTRY